MPDSVVAEHLPGWDKAAAAAEQQPSDGDDGDGKWQWQKVNKSLQIFAWVVQGARGGRERGLGRWLWSRQRDVVKLLSTTLKLKLKLGLRPRLRQQSELETAGAGRKG